MQIMAEFVEILLPLHYLWFSNWHHIEEQYDKLAIYKSSETDGVTEQEKMTVGFCILAEYNM
jgi:hypothetical protein